MPTLRSRFDAVVSENVSDCRIRNVQAEVGQGSLDTVVAPCGILPGHAENELGHLVRHPWPARRVASTAVVPFLGDEPTVPTQNRVGSDDGSQFGHGLATQCLALDRQHPSVLISEQNPLAAHLLHEGLDLSVLEFDDVLLPAVDPTGENEKKQLPGLEDESHPDSVTNAGRGDDDFREFWRNRGRRLAENGPRKPGKNPVSRTFSVRLSKLTIRGTARRHAAVLLPRRGVGPTCKHHISEPPQATSALMPASARCFALID